MPSGVDSEITARSMTRRIERCQPALQPVPAQFDGTRRLVRHVQHWSVTVGIQVRRGGAGGAGAPPPGGGPGVGGEGVPLFWGKKKKLVLRTTPPPRNTGPPPGG